MNGTLDAALVAAYGNSAPRYTSYPPATQFHSQFGAGELADAIGAHDPAQPWSLYVHIPFCASVCYYCACNKIVTKHTERSGAYIARLGEELKLLAPLLGRRPALKQLHWGGGTPTFLSQDEMRVLMGLIAERFALLEGDEGEYSIEIDPRHAPDDTLHLLRALGFNRLSFGIQDFDPRVQTAIHREQPYALVARVFATARKLGFQSLSTDLIYGLPHQSRESFAQTVEQLLTLSPERISLFNYAHLPERFAPQRRIQAADLPAADVKLGILGDTIDRLRAAGYVYIGLDHFAKADDELAVAQQERTLGRNFQGYTTNGGLDVLGIGASAVSRIGNVYSQNAADLEEYEASLDRPALPVRRGFSLNGDDLLRREVITDLLCHMNLDVPAFERKHNLSFRTYFASELMGLGPMQHDGLVDIDENRIQVTPRGQLLVRAICAVFDRYLRASNRRQFSRVV
ncbi:MAG: oxygen-independent coproporphyrinogen III oxidase [Gammaproteobacteria bacterium]|nr:oxygen-independent coproporphyrinogen III oxidase [Gammaproteobacteria bacterium]